MNGELSNDPDLGRMRQEAAVSAELLLIYTLIYFYIAMHFVHERELGLLAEKDAVLHGERIKNLDEQHREEEEENKNERDFATLAKHRYDELKKKFERTSAAFVEKNKECVQLVNEMKILKRELANKESENNEIAENLKRAEKKIEDIENVRSSETKCLQDSV
ncbi:unnamed protein product [Gongylonema pulchrum]|uniref:TACC_C domain-containing protein n=1 Tax=Gongylonema pulchrum TaxID=637853 RepID=A0A183E5I9_9BILA|nr:unnamed protein product [Gongylonema pulchrum]